MKLKILKHPRHKFTGFEGGCKFVRSITILPDNSACLKNLGHCEELTYENALRYCSEHMMKNLKYFKELVWEQKNAVKLAMEAAKIKSVKRKKVKLEKTEVKDEVKENPSLNIEAQKE